MAPDSTDVAVAMDVEGDALARWREKDAWGPGISLARCAVLRKHGLPRLDAFEAALRRGDAKGLERVLEITREEGDARSGASHALEPYGVPERVAEARRRFDRCSAEYERSRDRFLALTKDARPDQLSSAESELGQTRRVFETARFELMAQLHGQGISITSMRNRENRLEQMFVSLLEQSA